MSSDLELQSPLLTDIDQLVAILRDGEKKSRRVGTEREFLAYRFDTLAPPSYDDGILPLLKGMIAHGWRTDGHDDRPVSLLRDGAALTLEPGGQVELSGAPYVSIHEAKDELLRFRGELAEVGREIGVGFMSLGYRPVENTEEVPWMPKPRYAVMRSYLPTRGRAALEMMLLSGTVQANFDYTSEADMTDMMLCSMRISPIVAALFACSPYVHGRFTGFRTRRYAMWRDVDPDRCGLLRPALLDGFGYRSYVEWALDIPMFFVRRDGAYVQTGGITFRKFWQQGFLGHKATVQDFHNHLSTLFPEVRIKSHLEVRSADAGPFSMTLALPALWKGLLYDAEARKQTSALLANLSFEEMLGMQIAVAQDGLAARGVAWQAFELASALVGLAQEGLGRQGLKNASGHDETVYLRVLQELLTRRQTFADMLLEQFGSGPFDEATLRKLYVWDGFD